MAASTQNWTKLNNIDSAYITDPMKISSSKFTVYDYDDDKLLTYNCLSDEWSSIDQEEGMGSSIVFDTKSNRYFAYVDPEILVFDGTDMRQHMKINITNETENRTRCAVIFANDKFHIIGGDSSKSHTVFNPETKEIKTVHTFDEFNERLSDAGLLYVSSKNYLLLLGGLDDDGWNDDIWKCDLNNDEYKWIKSEFKIPNSALIFTWALTSNERYIICGYEGTIYYLDLEGRNEWIESEIKYPDKNCSTFTMMGDGVEYNHIIIDGFIRKIDMEIPQEIVGMILNYYCCEEIHTIDSLSNWFKGTSGHWKIGIKQIIPEY